MRRRVARLAVLAAVAMSFFVAPDARAAGPFVDAPLTLPPWHVAADVGVGFGTFQNYGFSVPSDPTSQLVVQGGTQVGWGSSLEAAVGLPFVGQVGVRLGYRFGSSGASADADQFARLFDPVVSEPGGSSFANPEILLRGTLLNLSHVEVGLESRFIIPTDSSTDIAGNPNSYFTATPAVPVRIHVPGVLRVDTGLWVPLTFDSTTGTTILSFVAPVQLFFQTGNAFFGPETGFRFNVPGNGEDTSVDIPLGVAAGYTLAGSVDLKVQVRTDRVNDANWASRYLGGGAGVGLRLP